MTLTYWQISCLKMALRGHVRRMSSPAIPSLVKRGFMVRWGGRPGRIFYAITDAGLEALAQQTAAEKKGQP
jgi:hypothetical protein